MTDLKKRFERRSEILKEETQKILDEIPNVIAGAVRFLNLGAKIDESNMSWEEVALLDDQEYFEGGTVLLVGVVSYEPGEKFTLPNGESVDVDEANADYFRRVIRIGVPYALAMNGTVEDVVEFLFHSATELEEDLSQEQPMQPEQTDFDLSELTDEQRHSLEMFLQAQRSDD